MRDVPRRPSNWRSQVALPEWLRQRGIVAIADIDTRKLTRMLRERGAQNGALMAGGIDADKAIEAARKFPGLKGMDLAKVVSTDAAYPWTEGQPTWTATASCMPSPGTRSSPTTSAPSATSCACSPNAAAT